MNFANEGASYSLRGGNNKLIAVEMVRDFFGSIPFLVLQRKIDMAKVLSFPLAPTPLSLSHTDGTMLKTQKSKLMEKLESKIFSEKPHQVDVTIIDAMFFSPSAERSTSKLWYHCKVSVNKRLCSESK